MSAGDVADDHADLVLLAEGVKVFDVGDSGRLEGAFRYGARMVAVEMSCLDAEQAIVCGFGHGALLGMETRVRRKGRNERPDGGFHL